VADEVWALKSMPIKAIQEQQEMIDQQQKEIEALKLRFESAH
jgi:hypothetical protein